MPESHRCHVYTGKTGDKLTLGQELHLVASPCNSSPFKSLTRQMDDKCSYNSVSSSVDRSKQSKVLKTAALNPATLLLDDDPKEPHS
jgi:hypothetical protein